MADVYLATVDGDAQVLAAIKQPKGSLPPDVSGEMFLREAEAASRIDHQNVVRVVDFGDEPPFIAFEFVDGQTLDRDIARRRGDGDPLDSGTLLEMAKQLVEGLAAINVAVVHRDFKPANVFALPSGRLLISDFGLSKYVGEATRSKTFKGWGTLPYLAPEALRGDGVDWRVDQYALGVTLFELAVLRRPFKGSDGEIEEGHLFKKPPRVADLRNDIPARLSNVIARMLEKQAAKRFGSWDEVRLALVEIDAAPLPPNPLAAAAARRIDAARSAELAVLQAKSASRQRGESAKRFSITGPMSYSRRLLTTWTL